MRCAALILAALAMQALLESALGAALDQREAAQPGGQQMTITRLGGGTKKVDFLEGETVGQLRARIAQLDGQTADSLILVFAGKQLEGDAKPLSEYGVEPGSKIIYLQRPGKGPAPVAGQSVEPRAEQEVPAAGQATKASPGAGPVPRPLAAASEPPESAVQNLFVRLPTGEVLEVPAEDELRVGQLKRVLELLTMAPSGAQRLSFQGARLDDNRSLAESGLLDGSALALDFDERAAQAEARVLDRAVKRIVANMVARINNNGRPMTKLSFKHDPHFMELETVQQTIGERILMMVQKEKITMPLLLEAYRSEELRVEIAYEFRGVHKSTLANLSEGAKWVVEQAKAAAATEGYQAEPSESDIFGEASQSAEEKNKTP